jgi:hypothetical protein
MKCLICILTILAICALSAGCADPETQKEEFTVSEEMGSNEIGSNVRLIIIPDYSQDCGPDFSKWESYPRERCTKYQLQKIMSQPDSICDILKMNTIYDDGSLAGAEIYLRKNTSIGCTL